MHCWCRILPALASCLLASASQAAFDAYLKIDGVPGESTDSKHAGWIDVESFGSSAAKTTNAVPASFSALCLNKFTDKSSPVLDQKCAQGVVFPSAHLELITSDAARLRYYQITLSNVVVSSVSTSGGPDRPQELVCLNFNWIAWTYTQFDATGAPSRDIRAWWDLALNRGGDSLIPVFRVTGTQVTSTELQLSWVVTAGKTYTIFSSAVVTGPYSNVVERVTALGDGSKSIFVPLSGSAGFFTVQQAP